MPAGRPKGVNPKPNHQWHRTRASYKKYCNFRRLIDSGMTPEQAFESIYYIVYTKEKYKELMDNIAFAEKFKEQEKISNLPISKANLVSQLWKRFPKANDGDAVRIAQELAKLLGYYAPAQENLSLSVEWKEF